MISILTLGEKRQLIATELQNFKKTQTMKSTTITQKCLPTDIKCIGRVMKMEK